MASGRQAESGLLATFTGRKLPLTEADVVVGFAPHVTSLSDYYPFGSGMKGRGVTEGYRYGFNAMEREDELYAPGSAYDFGARMYDGRLGRFMSVDLYANLIHSVSTYQFANNRPIDFIDKNGNSGIAHITESRNEKTGRRVIEVQAHWHLFGPNATPDLATAVQAELNQQYNNAGDYFTYTDDNGEVFDVIFDFKVDVVGLGDALNGIRETDPVDNYYLVAEGYGNSYTLTSQRSDVVGGNTGYLSIEQLNADNKNASHEANHNLGGMPHAKKPRKMDGHRVVDISFFSGEKDDEGNVIDISSRGVTQDNINYIFKNAEFNSSGQAVLGHARRQMATGNDGSADVSPKFP